MVRSTAGVADKNDFAEMRETVFWYCLHLREKACTDDRDLSARVVQHVFVIVRLGLGVDGNSYRADFNCAEEAV